MRRGERIRIPPNCLGISLLGKGTPGCQCSDAHNRGGQTPNCIIDKEEVAKGRGLARGGLCYVDPLEEENEEVKEGNLESWGEG